MNIDNFILLRDYWATLDPMTVDMASWFRLDEPWGVRTDAASIDEDDRNIDFTGNSCGTTACLAGHCQFKFANGTQRHADAMSYAKDWLGLTTKQADLLFTEGYFYGYEDDYHYDLEDGIHSVTHADVLTMLNRIIATSNAPFDPFIDEEL